MLKCIHLNHIIKTEYQWSDCMSVSYEHRIGLESGKYCECEIMSHTDINTPDYPETNIHSTPVSIAVYFS